MKCPKCHSDNPSDSGFCSKCGTQLLSPEEISAPTKTLEAPIEKLTTGSIFAGRYKIIKELGKGGMGRVYKALDNEISEEVALKLIKPEIAEDEKTIERFRNELKIARKVTHRNVCRMFDIGKEKETPYITMEFVEGEDLKSLVRKKGKIPEKESISIAKQVCEGLAEAHRLGVVHRDLKPQNIMIDKEGNAKIMDFGIAHSVEAPGVTQTGVMIGTPDYISPEQAEGEEADQRSDIYSLGVIFYEMVTGGVPFKGDTAFSVALKHKTQLPQDPRKLNHEVSENLSRLILICMEKDRQRRYQTAKALLSDLRNIEEGFPLGTKIRPRRETIVAIAVLPFKDLSPQKDHEYLCDGLADTLINALTHIKDLNIPARTSAFSFKGKEVDIKEISKKLNVDKILEGSVQKAGNRIRITAQLINVADGYHLWSERYDRELDDVFAIQDEISLAVVDKLKIELLGNEEAQLIKRYTDNFEAYNLYLKGLFFLNKRTPEAIKKGMEFFQQAIENDPTYALAYRGLAEALSDQGFYGFLPPNDTFPKAKAWIQKALEIDDTLVEVHSSSAWISLVYDWDWERVEREIKKALKLNPNHAMSHYGYAIYLMTLGRYVEAIMEAKRALELDPLAIDMNLGLGAIFIFARQYDEAIEQLRKTLEMDPNHPWAHMWLGDAYIDKEMWEEAIVEFRNVVTVVGDWPHVLGYLGMAYGLSGQTDEALKVLNRLNELSKEMYVSSLYKALIFIGLGKKEQAIGHLEKAYLERTPYLIFLSHKQYDKLRSDPKFKTLLKKVGLEWLER